MQTEKDGKDIAATPQRGSIPLAFSKKEQPVMARPGNSFAMSGTKTITNVRRENSDDD
ncbi:MAG: hypothetical protein ISS31_02245 [Kiritimatiellae bacterium]|nr:hypothetical protein [Kiritimatiellia bacterium]